MLVLDRSVPGVGARSMWAQNRNLSSSGVGKNKKLQAFFFFSLKAKAMALTLETKTGKADGHFSDNEAAGGDSEN